jgi:hypothetical protein
MLYQNMGVGWVVTLKRNNEAFHIERLTNDENRNLVFQTYGSPNFVMTPNLQPLAPPTRLEIHHEKKRILLYFTRKPSGVRMTWRDQDYFTILRHKRCDMNTIQVTEATDPVEFILIQTHNRIRDLVVDLNGESITLYGRCTSFHAKQLAQEAARYFNRNIINHIKVNKNA